MKNILNVIKEKGKKAVLTASAFAILAGGAGCATIIHETPFLSQTYDALPDALAPRGLRKLEEQEEREMQRNPYKRSGFKEAFTSAGEDLDGDGKLDYNEAKSQIKNVFEANEKIYFNSKWEPNRDFNLAVVLKDEEGRPVLKIKDEELDDRHNYFFFWDWARLDNNGGTKKLTVEYLIDGQKLREAEHEIYLRGNKREVPKRNLTLEERYEEGKEDLFFNCKQFVDENNDGVAQFKEFKGINTSFKENEKFLSVAVIRNNEGRVEKLIANPNGSYVKNKNGETIADSGMLGSGNLLTFENGIYFDKNDGPGNYTDIYYLDGKEVGRNSFYVGDKK